MVFHYVRSRASCLAIGTCVVVFAAVVTNIYIHTNRQRKEIKKDVLAFLDAKSKEHVGSTVSAHLYLPAAVESFRQPESHNSNASFLLIDKKCLDHNVNAIFNFIGNGARNQVRFEVESIPIPTVVHYVATQLAQRWEEQQMLSSDTTPLSIGLSTSDSACSSNWMGEITQPDTKDEKRFPFSSILQRQPPETLEEARLVLQTAQLATKHQVCYYVSISNRKNMLLLLNALQEVCSEGAVSKDDALHCLRLFAKVEPCGSPIELSVVYSLLVEIRSRLRRRETTPQDTRQKQEAKDIQAKLKQLTKSNIRSPADVLTLISLVAEMNRYFQSSYPSACPFQLLCEGVLLRREELPEDKVSVLRFIVQTYETETKDQRRVYSFLFLHLKQIIFSLYSATRVLNPLRRLYHWYETREVKLRRQRVLEWYYFTNITWSRAGRKEPFLLDECGVEEELREQIMVSNDHQGKAEHAADAAHNSDVVVETEDAPMPAVLLTARHVLGEFETDFFDTEGRRATLPSLFVWYEGASQVDRKVKKLFRNALAPVDHLYLLSSAQVATNTTYVPVNVKEVLTTLYDRRHDNVFFLDENKK
ncbi:hypothetical protein AGDE_14491 [Angomonas deanei]|uniref:Uncharacterized protein n=1 Tax=Angomonas deanei TaxID=59799 RepID=A0A7G2CKS2_9TRYP|nr:hypothetical protein AGDE_14491 [Angomonas deanei]CAD2220460.1 hypothetical protein, conserved [Angomonas deanei]|eukprot:EPY20774.1 hypothetical protein AGDE_14491 [Angomonas deanei]